MMKKLRQLAVLLFATLLLGGTASMAGTLQASADGTVTDSATGLVWMRCSMGQTWSGATCLGNAGQFTFSQASALTGKTTFAGQSDWRVPSIREIDTLLDYAVLEPKMDAVIFPNTPIRTFYSSSTSRDGNDANAGFAWVASTGGGHTSFAKTVDVPVRMVRGNPATSLLNIARPTSDYTDQGNGTVLHKPTNLTWQRCMVGQNWTGTTCTGSASLMTWDQAKLVTSNFAGQTDWRLPTPLELLSLVDFTKDSNAINADIFPENLQDSVWSGAPTINGEDTNFAWAVDKYGYFNSESKTNYPFGVRLVRSTPPVDQTSEFFSWAEAQYPTLFPLPAQSGIFADYTYRYYATSGLVLAVQNRQIYGFGDVATNRQMLNLTAAVCSANPALALCAVGTR